MSIAERSPFGVWGSRTTFVLALATSAVGLGNLWRFSYLVGENGGAPFIAVYIFTLVAIAVPVLIAEIVIGSHGRGNPVNSLLHASDRSAASRGWVVIGWIAGFAALMILSYLSVVGGWSIGYIPLMDSGVFADSSAVLVGQQFADFLHSPRTLVYWQTIFIALTFAISGLGIHRGLGVLFWFALPLLWVVLGVLIQYALEFGDMVATSEYLFSASAYDFTAESALIAMGQAFYTLSIGAGVGLAFGAYTPDKLPIGRTVLAVAVVDVTVSIAAGLAIFPIIFAANLEPSMGPGLMFVSLPYAFGNMPGGETMGLIFFVAVAVTSLGSAVALAEAPMAYLVQRMRIRRPLAAIVLAGAIWILALGCAMSFNMWKDLRLLGNRTLFELMDWLAADIMLPLACLLTSLYVGYALNREVLRLEMYRERNSFFFLWHASLRYIAPPVIVALMLLAVLGPL